MKLSIITIVLNDKQNIEKTILSVLSQGVEVEYIIIDGGSTDGTLDIIKKYKDRIDVVVSEKDSGIYNAMNKAIDLVGGDWICFMNSGDMFYDSNVLKNVLPNFDDELDVVYGDWEVRYENKKRVLKADKNIENIWKGMIFSHQSCLVRKEILLKNPFNINSSIAADFELFYSLFKKGYNFQYIPITIASVSAGGVSDKKRFQSILARYKVIDKTLYRRLYYLNLLANEGVKFMVKKLIGLVS